MIVSIIITDESLELFRRFRRPLKLFLLTSLNNLRRVITNTIQSDLQSISGISKRSGRVEEQTYISRVFELATVQNPVKPSQIVLAGIE